MGRPAKPWYRAAKDSWYATVGGRQTNLGVRGRGSVAAAFAAWHSLTSGAPPHGPRTATANRSPDGSTVSAAVAAYLADAEKRLAASSLIWYRHATAALCERFGPRNPDSLGPAELGDWLASRVWGPTSRCHAIGVLCVVFRWAQRAGYCETNPFATLRKPARRSRGAAAAIGPADVERLIAVAGPPLSRVLRVLHATGARPSEAARITAENFDPAAAVVRLAEHKTAHRGRTRTLFLTPAAVAVLTELRARIGTGPLLLNGRGRPWTKDAIVLAMRRLSRRTGIAATAYGFRHTFATDALAAGVPDTIVAELLGHSGTAMLHRHYAHLGAMARTLRDAAAKVRD